MTDDELIDGYFHDGLSPEEVARLEERLKADSGVRERYRRYGEMVYGLETLSRTSQSEQESEETSGVRQPLRFLAPWMQIAAACVLTAILASTASAWYVERQLAKPAERLAILQEGFESETVAIKSRFPMAPGVWRADGNVISRDGSMPATVDGDRYLRLEPHKKRKLSYVDGVIDLREVQRLRVERGAKRVRLYCRAAIRPETVEGKQWVHYRLRVASFASSPEQTVEDWRQGPPQFYGETYSHRAVRVSTGRDQWHLLETTVDVPEDVQSAMLSVSASANAAVPANHLVDAISATLVFEYELED